MPFKAKVSGYQLQVAGNTTNSEFAKRAWKQVTGNW
jgi:hypothetical protein